MTEQTGRVGRADAVALFRAQILRLRAPGAELSAQGGSGPSRGEPPDRVEISDAARLLAQMADPGRADDAAAALLAGAPSDERLTAFLQAYGGIYGVDFGIPAGWPAGEAYDRRGRRVRAETLEALRRELRRYGAAAAGDGREKEAAPRRSAGLPRMIARLWRRIRRLLG